MTVDTDIDATKDLAIANLRYMDLPSLSRQELEFAAAYAATSDIPISAKRAGVSTHRGGKWVEREDIQLHVKALLAPHQEEMAKGVRYELADAHADIEIGKRMSSTATEWFRGVELHMRLHNLGEKKAGPEVSMTINVNSRQQLEQIDDDQLLKMAGFSYEDLLPEAIEGEIVTRGDLA